MSGRSIRPGPRSSSGATSAARTSPRWPSGCSARGVDRPRRRPRRAPPTSRSTTTRNPIGRVVHVVHRPGSVQTEIRIGHRGVPRRIPDFHAVSVMSAILGGLFNSRLNMKLREEKGYTYGAGAGFDMRRGAGPFAARAAVNTEVTVPAITETLAELDRIRDDARVRRRAARPPATSSSACSRSASRPPAPSSARWRASSVHDLGVDELVGYRREIEAVGIDEVASAAGAHPPR